MKSGEIINIIGEIASKSQIVVFRWNRKAGWQVELVSDNVYDLTGYDASEFMEDSIVYEQLIATDDIVRVRKEVNYYCEQTREDSFHHSPYRIIHREGHIKWVDDFTTIVRDDKGDVLYLEGIITDCTSRISAEQALKEKEMYINTVEMRSGFASAEYVSGQIHLYSSPNLARLLNTEEENQNQSFDSIEHAVFPEDYSRVREQHERFLKGPVPYHMVYRITARDGEIRYIRESVHVDVDDAQEFNTIFSFQDITDDYYSHKKIELLERHFRLLYKGAPVPLWELNVERVHQVYRRMDMTIKEVLSSPDSLAKLREAVHLVELNDAAMTFFDMKNIDDFKAHLYQLFPDELLIDFVHSLSHRHYSFHKELRLKNNKGFLQDALLSVVNAPADEQNSDVTDLYCSIVYL